MSIYDGISTATLQTRLVEAQDALHALLVGTKTVSLSLGDKRLTFANAPDQIAKLTSYIAQLQTAIAIAQGTTPANTFTSVATWTR